MVRRHKKGLDNKEHHGPQVQTVSGNYVAGKRKGVVDGVDLGFTGVVNSLLQTQSIYYTSLSRQVPMESFSMAGLPI
jgi:acetylglutamate kinase